MRYLNPILALLFCAISAHSQTTYPSGVTGCIARWDFNTNGTITTLDDVSGNNHHGTTTNLVTASNFRNFTNMAMGFNGTSSYAIVPHHTGLNPQEITIIGVVRFDDFYQGDCQCNNIIYKGFSYYIPGAWSMQTMDNDGNCGSYSPSSMSLEFSGATIVPYTLPANNPVSLSQWYFFAVSYDGNIIRRYQVPMDSNVHYANISAISSNVMATPLGSNTYDVRIGATQNPPFPYNLNGDIDEIVLFDKELTVAEVQSVYDYLWGGVLITAVDTTLCTEDTFTISYSVLNTDNFQPGNVMTAQLSDANGSFANPVNIGSVVSSVSGSISCVVPVSTPSGTNYKIRISSSDASMRSPDNGQTIAIGQTTADVTLSISPGTIVPSSTTVTFTAIPNNTGTSIFYYWKKNGNLITGADTTSPIYTAVADVDFVTGDVFSVDIIVTDTVCFYEDSASSFGVGMTVVLSVNEVNDDNNLSMHPNPNKGVFTLEGNMLSNAKIDLIVTNMLGQIIHHEDMAASGSSKKEIRLPQYQPGIYFLRVSSGGIVRTLRFSVL